METLCNTTCAAIGRYYKSLGQSYDRVFSEYCEENGIDDDDGLRDEMQESPSDCLLIDFDDNFPFKTKPKNTEARQKFIHNLIKNCMNNPHVGFGGNMPDFKEVGAQLFDLKKYNLDTVRATYKEQCKALYNNTWETDEGFLTILAVGKKYDFDYMLHLVDDYNRWRIKNHNKKGFTDSTAEWAAQTAHFKQLNNMKLTLKVKKETKHVTYTELATGAVNSFSKRVAAKLQFGPMKQIDDSLESIIYYINDAVNFVYQLATNKFTKKTICPFQIDFCMVLGKAIDAENKDEMKANPDDGGDDDDDDDDDDEVDDEKGQSVNPVGDIEQRLDANNLKYYKGERKDEDERKESRVFPEIYKNFVSENKLKGSENSEYLHQKRLITMIDRRQSKNNTEKPDDIWMYEPPSDCQNISSTTVPEWYINSSATCVAPSTGPEKDDGFGATSHCKGETLTLSFHVKQEKRIKCYLFWNGQMIRFLPDDIKTILPQLFNPEQHPVRNEDDSKALDAMIRDMKAKLVDEEFDAFVASYTYNN